MDPMLVGLLAFLIAFAALCSYYGFLEPVASRFRYGLQSGFAFLTVVLIPLLILALADQRGAAARLAREGVVPHPSIRHAVGAATGAESGFFSWLMRLNGTGDPVWIFEVGAPAEEILDFYRRPGNAVGWVVSSDSAVLLVLRRGTSTLTIAAENGWSSHHVIYTLRRK